MIQKLKLFWNLFKEGESVSDPVKWKTHQVSVNQVAALLATLVAIAAAFGYAIPVDSDTILAVAGGIFALVNWVFTIITTDKIGVFSKPTITSEESTSYPSDPTP